MVSELAQGLASNPLAWGLALALGAVGYLFKMLSEDRKVFARALEEQQASLVATLKEDAKEQREILSQIVPLASKIVDGIEALERISFRCKADSCDR